MQNEDSSHSERYLQYIEKMMGTRLTELQITYLSRRVRMNATIKSENKLYSVEYLCFKVQRDNYKITQEYYDTLKEFARHSDTILVLELAKNEIRFYAKEQLN
ncbi:MAG: hypothetical protein LBT04_04390 [Prevotellaceae bacterium]|jgi:hypothetical protein|nr:hypothetical protein [Prevotellaceae bacterium]